VDGLLAAHRIDLARAPESLCIKRLPGDEQPIVLIAGSDARGLSYAILEAARSVELAEREREPWGQIAEAVETPLLRVRAMSMHLFNKDLEESWYFDERFWRGYFAMLARHRYNQFTLTFSDQTNYLTPLYAYLVEVAGHDKVKVKGLSNRDRQRNLSMLKCIAELARKRGLDFNLGIWAQAPTPIYPGDVLVENLPEGLLLADYCSQGLKRILQACPAITGVQFRMNTEAGISSKMQAAFFKPLFKAIRDCGWPIRLDLRFKGLLAETIQAAIDAGLDPAVSIKFWCEHMGLPYHPTVADRRYREDRYSYGALLAQPRQYRIVYQLWSMGSQRVLLWGDPEYAARFAQSCQFGGGEGFEVYAPLTNRGYGSEPGKWRIFADASHEVGTWEYERYWFFYLAFGRMGYNPRTDPAVWRREFRQRFGTAAEDVEKAYGHASQIIPFVTATHLPSASEWWWWPEMDTGGRLPEYQHAQPSDTAQFYAIRTWKRTPKWIWEEWDDTIPGYAQDAVAGRVDGKMTPFDMSRTLQRLAGETEACLGRARAKAGNSVSAEFRGTLLDLQVLADLGHYHAEKMQAAAHLALFDLTQEAGRLPEALKHMRAAADSWAKIVRQTDKVYHDNLAFGIPKGNPRSRGGQRHDGHWKDRQAEIGDDVAFLEGLVKMHGGAGQKFRSFPGEAANDNEFTVRLPSIASAKPGVDLTIDLHLQMSKEIPLKQLVFYYRTVDQTAEWKQVKMKRHEERWQATIPGSDVVARSDLMYYIDAQYEQGGGFHWPTWQVGPPYVVIPVDRPKK
jgi:hypothetical protein